MGFHEFQLFFDAVGKHDVVRIHLDNDFVGTHIHAIIQRLRNAPVRGVFGKNDAREPRRGSEVLQFAFQKLVVNRVRPVVNPDQFNPKMPVLRFDGFQAFFHEHVFCVVTTHQDRHPFLGFQELSGHLDLVHNLVVLFGRSPFLKTVNLFVAFVMNAREMVGNERVTGVDTEICVFAGFQEPGQQSGADGVPGAFPARFGAAVVGQHPVDGRAAEGVFGWEPHGSRRHQPLTCRFVFKSRKRGLFDKRVVERLETDRIRVLENPAIMVENFPPHDVGFAVDFGHAVDGHGTFEIHAPTCDFVLGPADVFEIGVFIFEGVHEFGGGGFGADPQLM